MWQAISIALKDSRIRAVAVALLLLGFTFASAFPFQSIIGVEQLHMSERAYALAFVGAAFAAMIGNVVLGAISDFAKSRKVVALSWRWTATREQRGSKPEIKAG